HESDRGTVDRVLVEVDELHPDLAREGRDELRLREHALLDEDAAEGLAARRGLVERGEQLGLADETFVEQDLPELTHANLPGRARHGAHSRAASLPYRQGGHRA